MRRRSTVARCGLGAWALEHDEILRAIVELGRVFAAAAYDLSQRGFAVSKHDLTCRSRQTAQWPARAPRYRKPGLVGFAEIRCSSPS